MRAGGRGRRGERCAEKRPRRLLTAPVRLPGRGLGVKTSPGLRVHHLLLSCVFSHSSLARCTVVFVLAFLGWLCPGEHCCGGRGRLLPPSHQPPAGSTCPSECLMGTGGPARLQGDPGVSAVACRTEACPLPAASGTDAPRQRLGGQRQGLRRQWAPVWWGVV